MTTKDRSSDTTRIFYLGIIMTAWLSLIVLCNYAARWCIHGAFLAGYGSAGGRGLLALAVVCCLLDLYAIAFGLIVLISTLLVNISKPAQRRYSAHIDRGIGKLPPFRPAARLIRPSDTTQHTTRSENGQ